MFLKAKHWQLFCLIFVLPTVAEIVAAIMLPTDIKSWGETGVAGLVYLGVMLVDLICGIFWLVSIGTFLNGRLAPEVKMGTRILIFASYYPVLYILVFFWGILSRRISNVGVVLSLHLLCMASLIYLINFAAKSLALTEGRRAVSLSDYAWPFFLFWFYPVGVWILQPKINRLYAASLRRANRYS